MKLYNTLTREKEDFVPRQPGKVSMYTCGPTVYHFAHIGNLRSYIMEDVLEKFLRYEGRNVKRVMNITDVGHLASDADEGEDKMLTGAKREHKSVLEIAQFYTDAFFDDCEKLNIKRPDVVEPATNCIDEYIKIITRLIDTGYAYRAGGNVYFDTSRLERYYIFNDYDAEDLAVGVREGVEEDANKRNKNDFVLWFTKSKFEDQALKWDSPWGVGYPGWHIECSGISMKHLGEDLDIHCVLMAYIQLSLYGIPAVVLHGNTITTEEFDRWYTPIYILDRWVWRKPLGMTGKRSLDDEKLKVCQEPMYGLIRYPEWISVHKANVEEACCNAV